MTQDGATRLAAFSRLVLALNTALLTENPWREFLLMLREQANARYGTLILTPPDLSRTTMITPTATSESIQRYIDRYLEIDPFVNLPEGKVTTLYEYVDEAALKNTVYYKEWLETMDGSHVLGVDLRMSGGYEARLRLTRAPGGEPFTREEMRWVEDVVPHLRQAIEFFQRLETSRSEHAVMIGAIEQFAVGTVVLDHNLKILKMNEVAASILAEGDGIALVGGRVALSQPAQDAELRKRLKEAVAAPDSAGRSVFLAERRSGRRDIGIVIQSVQIPGFMHTGSAPALALFLGDPERQCVVTSDAVRKLFNFTPTEAAISASLANGVSVIETAHRLGIAENTVRAHLRSIFAKTGVARQSQLVHLIHTSLPELTLPRT